MVKIQNASKMMSNAQLLDELMGRDRNLAPSENRRETHWNDPDVCKFFLVSFCPHELFVNTRADLGACDKLHDENLKKNYQKSSRFERMGYEEEFLRFLQTLLSDVERRIRKGQARLALNNAQANMAGGPQSQKEEKIKMLTEKINDLVQQAEELGCEGKVEEAQGMMKLCEQLREERSQVESDQLGSLPLQKEMEVCEICGAFLVVGDAKQRLAEHMLGKQHMGYAQVRATMESMKMPAGGPQGPEHVKDMQVCEVCGALLVVGDVQQRVDEHLLGKQHMGYAQIRSYITTRREATRKKLRGEDTEREARLAKEREDREKEREKEREEREKEREERRKKREQEEKEREERRKDRRRTRSRSKSRSSRRRSRSRSRSKRSHRSRSRDRHRHSRHSSRGHDRHRSRSRDRRRDDKDRSSRDRKSRDRRSREKSSSKNEHKSENEATVEGNKEDNGDGNSTAMQDRKDAQQSIEPMEETAAKEKSAVESGDN